jgi:glc operon protein GlcG
MIAVAASAGAPTPRTTVEVAMSETNETANTRPTLSAHASEEIIDAAIAAAREMSVRVTAVTVDESGVTKGLHRMDGAPLVSLQTAINKAYAAAAIGMPPDEFYGAIESDAAATAEFGTRPGLALIAGGIPIVREGQVAGAVGIAGAITGAEDRRIAELAVETVAGRPL